MPSPSDDDDDGITPAAAAGEMRFWDFSYTKQEKQAPAHFNSNCIEADFDVRPTSSSVVVVVFLDSSSVEFRL